MRKYTFLSFIEVGFIFILALAILLVFFGFSLSKKKEVSFYKSSKETFQKKDWEEISPSSGYTNYLAKKIADDLLEGKEFPEAKKIEYQKTLPILKEEFKKKAFIFQKKDLNLTLDNSTTSIVSFVGSFFSLVKESGLSPSSTFEALKDFAYNSKIERLEETINSINYILSNFSKISVPSNYEEITIDYLNTLSLKKEIYKSLISYKKDPLKAMIASQLINESDQKIEELSNKMGEKLTNDLGKPL